MFARVLGKQLFRRFARARRGSAAVEFSIVALPFFVLMFGLAEVAMIGFAQTSLDFAVSETARQIRTGQAQMGGLSRADIEEQLCDEVNNFIILSCGGNLFLDVKQFASFVDAGNDNNDPINDDGEFDDSGFGYQPGAPADIIVVRAYYRWHVMTPMFEPVFQNISGGDRILVSTMMFRNEPYQ
jgi:Flp pilus assembly protein TadG